MKFTDHQIRRLSEAVLRALEDTDAATLKADRPRVLSRVEEIIRANLAGEQSLEDEARKLLDEHLRQAPAGVDRHRLLQMIKKKLAEERGIPL